MDQSSLSMGLSVFASVSSAVLWGLQFYERQPRLRAYWVGLNRFAGHVYPLDDLAEVQPLFLRVAVANLSSTPDALLEAHFEVRGRDGGWLPSRPYLYLPACAAEVASQAAHVTALPINLPPKQTVLLARYLQVAVPRGVDFADYVADPFVVRAELVGLSGRSFRTTLVKPEPLDTIAESSLEAAA